MDKIRRLVILFAICFCAVNVAQASENEETTNNTQSIEQMVITEDGVDILVEGNWLTVDALLVQSEGIFVLFEGQW